MQTNNKYEYAEIIEKAELQPMKQDKSQLYIFVAHQILAVLISIYSFSGTVENWFIGTGLCTPLLVSVVGFMYGVLGGIKWEKEEMVPLLIRTFTVQEFELDRYLKYKRVNRFIVLIAGYLSIIFSQWVWSQFMVFLNDYFDLFLAIEFVFSVGFVCIAIIFLSVLIFWVTMFQHFLKMSYSDIAHIIEFSDKYQESIKRKKEEEKKTMTERKQS
jgi:hypothetical protein